MILTVLEAQVPAEGAEALRAAYAAAGAEALPPGLVRTELLHDARDAGRWRIQTWWASREALDAMRSAGTPAGVLMFRAAGAEPTLSIFEVVDGLPRPAR
jgi:heme-degrading monooxygenase HmoA